MKPTDKKVKDYIVRAKKILGVEVTLLPDTASLLKLTENIVEVAKMLQREDIEFERKIRAL